MKENMVRLSFDIPIPEHILLKSECAKARLSIREFLHEQMLKGLEEMKKKEFREKMEKSIKQSKDGNVVYRGSFAKYAND